MTNYPYTFCSKLRFVSGGVLWQELFMTEATLRLTLKFPGFLFGKGGVVIWQLMAIFVKEVYW